MAVGGERRALDLEVGVVLHRDREERVWVRLGGWGFGGVGFTPLRLHQRVCRLHHLDAEAGEVQVPRVLQRQAGVVGVLQPVLQLHLHRQAPARAADHIGLLSVGETKKENVGGCFQGGGGW